MSWRLGKKRLRRVLVTRLRYLGDVVMATVVADALKAGDPDLEIGFLCESVHAPVLEGHPSLARIHRLGAARRGADAAARSATASLAAGRGTLGMIAELRGSRYDLAVDLFFNPRSAWLLRLAGIPLRIGGTTGSRRRLYTHAVPRHRVDDPHGILERCAPGGLGEHLCRLAPLVHEPTGSPFLPWLAGWTGSQAVAPRLQGPTMSGAAASALAAAGVAAVAPYLLFAPGATWPAKEWPAAHWTALARLAEADTGLPVVTLVPPGREGEWPDLPRRLEPLPLAEVLPLLAGARAVVAVDGGIMHAAVGYGTPVLALFGPTDPGIWFPYEGSTAGRVLLTRPPCHPCSRHACPPEEFVCLPSLGPEPALAALAERLAATAGPKGGAR